MPGDVPFRSHVDHAALVARVSEVCPLPRTATRVMALTREPNATFDKIAEAIESDPALASEILRVASSPTYATRYRQDDLRAACRVLGQRELHDLTAAMAMLATFHSSDELGLHCHEVGALAAQLAGRTCEALRIPGQSKAFLAGLLSEIGALACLSVDARAYVALRRENTSETERVFAEQRRYKATSFAIGSHLLQRNGVGAEICKAVHGVDNDPLSSVVRFARIAATTMLHAVESDDHGWLDEVERVLWRQGLRLDTDELQLLTSEAYAATSNRFRALGAA